MENKKKKTNDILKQGTILAMASILVRMIGLLYRIPLGNLLEEDGNGIYSVAFTIYSLALIISSYGLPLAVSKMVAAKNVKGEYKNAHKIFVNSLLFATVIGGVVASGVYFGAEFLANAMKCSGAVMPLRILAPTIFCVALLGVLRGFFQGHNNMVPTAVSQILEQIANAIVSIVAAYFFMELHKNQTEVYSYGAAGSTLGTLTGAFTALLFMMGMYFSKQAIFKERRLADRHPVDSNKKIYGILFWTVVPVILSQTVYQLSGTVDTFLFGNLMAAKDVEESVRNGLLGAYSTQYTVLLSVPLGVSTAMGTSMIPSIVSSYTKEDMGEVKFKVKTVVKFNMLIALPSAAGLAVLAKPVNIMLFPRLCTYRDVAGNLLLYGSVALVFFALSTVTSGVLQAVNKMRTPVIHSSISLAIHVVVVYALLKYTDFGVYALVVGNVTFPLLVCILNWRSVGKTLQYKQEVKSTFVLPGIASLIMGACCVLVYDGSQFLLRAIWGECLLEVYIFGMLAREYIFNIIATFLAVLLGMLVYFVVLVKIKAVDEEELITMPMGRTLYKFACKMKLMKNK